MTSQQKTMLYHGTANIADRAEFLVPSWGETGTSPKYKGVPEAQGQRGKFIFAGEDQVLAHAYALRVNHPFERERGIEETRPYQFLVSVLDVPCEGERVVVAVLTRATEFLAVFQSALPKILAFPSENESYRFERIYDLDGSPTGEFICRTQVPLKDCQITILDGGIEQIMGKVQVFFLNEAVKKAQWVKATLEMADQRTFLMSMMEQSLLIHANRAFGVNPRDFRT
jgi:hypothetical protein